MQKRYTTLFCLGSRLLIHLSLRSWRRRGIPPRFKDHDDDSAENDERIGTKEDGEHVHLALEDVPIGLERLRHDTALVGGSAVARHRRCAHRVGKLREVPRAERQDVGCDVRQAQVEVLLQPCQTSLEPKNLAAHDAAQELASNVEWTPFSMLV